MEKYQKVLDLMRLKGGRVEKDDPDLVALLGSVYYRLPTFITLIRTKAHLEVRGVRGDGVGATKRRVIAYELAAVSAAPQSASVSV